MSRFRRLLSGALTGVLLLSAVPADAGEAKPRPAWTASRVQGSPDPPLPYRPREVFPHLRFQQPTVLTSAPGESRLFLAEQSGKIVSIPDDPDCKTADPFLDVNDLVKQANAGKEPMEQVALEAVYGMTFHPGFAENRRFYVCYVVRWQTGNRGQHEQGSRVVELRADRENPPRAILDTEREIITWLQGGHNGGCLKFGPDRMLYISTGDGGFAFPPDGRNAGQDVSNLLSAVLRINVDPADQSKPYEIPSDNPLLKFAGARGEIWAYGMRNPWKMSFDRQTGELWVGDVGWELWELVYRVKPGDNFGWSLVEGSQPVRPDQKVGPTPVTPATLEIPHTEAASITGGFVYRGQKLPELQGQYIFGDWETRRFWSVPVDGEKNGSRRELLEPTVRIVDFAERNDGELLLLDYDNGSIHEIIKNDIAPPDAKFPAKLSETGLFASVGSHQPAAGVLPFSINAPAWADYAHGERWLGLPGETFITVHPKAIPVPGSMFSRTWDYPKDAVLLKTLSLELTQGDPASRRRIETQLLHFNGYDWRGYSYRWNEAQTDANLVPATGETITVDVTDPQAPGGLRRQSWRFPSRMECIRCHNPWAEFALAFNFPQLNRVDDSGQNQLTRLYDAGVFREQASLAVAVTGQAVVEPTPLPEERPRLVDPLDSSLPLDQRARAYLHVNCAHCHRYNGGGSARIFLPFDTPLSQTEILDVAPTQGTFGIPEAKILAPGNPYRSTLYFRIAKAGPGHMPRLGSELIDRQGLALLHYWICQIPEDPKPDEQLDKLLALDEAAILRREQHRAEWTRWNLAKQIAQKSQREQPTPADLEEAAGQAERDARARVAQRQRQRAEILAELLQETRGTLRLVQTLHAGRLTPATTAAVLAAVMEQQDIAVRDLFEPFLPEEQRARRLGDAIDARQLLSLAGDAGRGRELFLQAKSIACNNCHKVGDQGKPLGPELTQIGKKLNREQLLESLLEPSKKIDPQFSTWAVQDKAGKLYSGLLVERTDQEIVIRDTRHQEHRLATDQIDEMFPQRISLMPDRLLRDLTAQQAADLLAWLESLK